MKSLLLDIPFYTQNNNQWRGDCGFAVMGCLANRTVAQVIAATGLPTNENLTFHHLYFGLRYFGIAYTYKKELTPDVIRGELAQKRPLILLVNYTRLPETLKAKNYDGSHWVLAVGFTDNAIIVHDPLSAAGAVSWPDNALKIAMSDITYFQIPKQGLVIQKKYPILQGQIAPALQAVAVDLTAELDAQTRKATTYESYLYQLYQALDTKGPISENTQGKAIARAMLRKPFANPAIE